MEIEMAYFIAEHEGEINLTLRDLAPGPLNILWFNNGHLRKISNEKVGAAINVLEDMSKHKGPDTKISTTFYWDDFKPML